MAKIYIDGKVHDVDPQENLLQVCLSLGLNLPYFCWHPAMGSVGACRQCAVIQYKDENDTQGKLVMSCMTPASEGTRISLEHPEAQAMRKEVVEWLMTNHPHDCPVCEEGGECHLQDMTVMSGHNYRRYEFTKRTHTNQYLGPFINHEMNRCIACYRCVRFYNDYAGGNDLNVFASRNNVYFGRTEDGVLENEFSGNLVEVCPTGVFTDKTLSEHYSRKWDIQTAPSVCTNCGLGCNTSPGERYGRLKRVTNRYHGEINGYFLCDRGRFGYQFVNDGKRPCTPQIRRNGKLQGVSKDEALRHAASLLSHRDRVIGIGSPRASLEANHALKTLVGAKQFSTGLSRKEQRLLALIHELQSKGPAHIPHLQTTELADAVFVLGEDVSNTAPRLALSLRQAVRQKAFDIAEQLKIPHWQDAAVRTAAQQQRSPLYMATPDATRLDDIATRCLRATPADIARLGFAVAHEINPAAPDVADLTPDQRLLAREIAQSLSEARRPLVVSGPGCQSEAVLQAAANIATALSVAGKQPDLCLTAPESNSLGVVMLGGHDLEDALQSIESGQADTVVILENDLYRRMVREQVQGALSKGVHVIVLDYLDTDTIDDAELVLPAGSFAEADGTLVNNEGRAQRFFQVYAPDSEGPMAAVQESWRWLRDMMRTAGFADAPTWKNLDAVTADCAKSVPILNGIVKAAPSAAFRMAGQKAARMSQRYSGRTAMRANISVHEPRTALDPDSSMSFSMEPVDASRFTGQGQYTLSAATASTGGEPDVSGHAQRPASVVPLVWMPGWNSNQAVNKFQDEVGGPLRGGDPGVRLYAAQHSGEVRYFAPTDSDPALLADEWRVVPLYEIFGSEELSARGPAIAERTPKAYVAIHPKSAARLNVRDNDEIELSFNGSAQLLPLKLRDSLPVGSVGIPQGLPGVLVTGSEVVRLRKAGGQG